MMPSEAHQPSQLQPKHRAIPAPDSWRGLVVAIAMFVLVGISVARIVSTYHVFSQTTDEPDHVAPGMEWLQWGPIRLSRSIRRWRALPSRWVLTCLDCG